MFTKPNIIIRCDADPEIGMGHLSRCRTLASELTKMGGDCIIIGPHHNYKEAEDAIIFSNWVTIPWKDVRHDANILKTLAHKYLSKCIVVDDYRIDEQYQQTLLKTGIPWLQFDGDMKTNLWADLVLNPTPGICSADYSKLLRKPTTKLLLGPQYAILREEFAIKSSLREEARNQVTLMFGGGDDRGLILFALRTLIPIVDSDVQFLVISGSNNPRNSEIAAWINAQGQGKVKMSENPNSVAAHLHGSAMAIISPGMSVYEAASCCVPIILIALTERQAVHAASWEREGLANFVGTFNSDNPRVLQNRLKQSYRQNSKLNFVSKHNERLVDGFGKVRVAKSIFELINTRAGKYIDYKRSL